MLAELCAVGHELLHDALLLFVVGVDDLLDLSH